MNSRESASAVPRSVTNVAAMIVLPISVFVSPVSTSTAYTTANEVVDIAIPAISDCRMSQPATKYANRPAPTNGSRNESPPMRTDPLSFRRNSDGSTSAPARNVSTMPANEARKSIHGVEVTPKAFPVTTPKAISMIATESPISTLTIEAMRIEKPTIVAMSS